MQNYKLAIAYYLAAISSFESALNTTVEDVWLSTYVCVCMIGDVDFLCLYTLIALPYITYAL